MSHCRHCGLKTRHSRNRGGGYLTRCAQGTGCRPWPTLTEMAKELSGVRHDQALAEHERWLGNRLPSEAGRTTEKDFSAAPIAQWVRLSNAERLQRARRAVPAAMHWHRKKSTDSKEEAADDCVRS